MSKCKRCDGTGDIGYQGLYSEKSDYRKCPLCNGTGEVKSNKISKKKNDDICDCYHCSYEAARRKPSVKMHADACDVLCREFGCQTPDRHRKPQKDELIGRDSWDVKARTPHKPPVKMRAVGWGVLDDNGRLCDSFINKETAQSFYPDFTIVRLYVRSK